MTVDVVLPGTPDDASARVVALAATSPAESSGESSGESPATAPAEGAGTPRPGDVVRVGLEAGGCAVVPG
ncbi:hypothetical protein [Cellulosimicrobium sp. CUA-896]|uniref:hypothetical protein n=1 Tax=Cellulosimicrobium sp. CUA-896 TaxID=1517881 RepID=UPI001115243E|nr:hypothetical protein [Cellulosimicrobium sp. CUA-896]